MNRLFHILDDDFNEIEVNLGCLHQAITNTLKNLDLVEPGVTLLVGATNGPFARNVPFYAALKLTKLSELDELRTA